jgi:hypothetical protein
MMNEAVSFSETPVLTRATRRTIPEDAILRTRIHCTPDLVVSITRRPRFALRNIIFVLLVLISVRGWGATGRIR